jgi:mono/diheme cytochrome c family protein
LPAHRQSIIRVAILLFAAMGWIPMVQAQDQRAGPSPADAQENYAKLCAGCHGADAHGSQQGPGLAGNAGVRRRSVQSLRNVILKGITGAGMPPFALPDADVDALVALLKSLNAPAADTTVSGDRSAGKAFFFGEGQCVSCHMVYGAGEPIGPDLSNVARELTVDQIRQALLSGIQYTPVDSIATVVIPQPTNH